MWPYQRRAGVFRSQEQFERVALVGMQLCRGLGLSASKSMVFEHDFRNVSNVGVPGGWVNDGTLNPTLLTDKAGGWVAFDSGALANAQVSIYSKGLPLLGSTAWKWAMEIRFRMAVGSLDANGRAYVGVVQEFNTRSITIGALGNLNTGNLIMQYDGYVAGSHLVLAPLDANVHTVRVRSLGDSILRTSLDGAAEVNVTQASGWSSVTAYFRCLGSNGATAASRSIEVDYAVVAGARS